MPLEFSYTEFLLVFISEIDILPLDHPLGLRNLVTWEHHSDEKAVC
jgi:hypothetical protein